MQNNVQRNPGTAAVLSFLFTGLGQLYNGQIFKGLVLIFCSASSLFIFLLGAILVAIRIMGNAALPGQVFIGVTLMTCGIIATCILGIYSIVHAYKAA